MRRTRHTALLCAVCALALFLSIGAMPSTLALYSAVDSDRHVLVFEESGDVNVSLTEALFDEDSAKGLTAGSTIVKDPVLQNNKGDAYARVFVQIVDDDSAQPGTMGKVLTPEADAERLEKILGAIWSDPEGSLEPGTAYGSADIAAAKGVTPVFNSAAYVQAEPAFNTTAGAYVFEHDGILKAGDSAALFDRICIPSDYTTADVQLMGNFSIRIWGQAIQVDGFSDQASAMAALTDEFSFDADGRGVQSASGKDSGAADGAGRGKAA